MQALWTISSIWSVVTPGFAAAAAMSSTSRASLHTFLMPSCAFASRISIRLRLISDRPALGMPSAA